MLMFEVYIVWGSHYEEEHAANPCHYTFKSEAEKNAFMRGVSEACGWLECMAFDSAEEHAQWLAEQTID